MDLYSQNYKLICSFIDVNGTNGTELINSTTTFATTIATTTKRVAVDLPKKGAAEEEHHSSFTIFFILLVVGMLVFDNQRNSNAIDMYNFVLNIAFFRHFEFSSYDLNSRFIDTCSLDNIFQRFLDVFFLFSALAILTTHMLIQTRFHYLPESIADILLGNFYSI